MARVVVDANIGVALIMNAPYSLAAVRQVAFWREREIEIVVPALWWYEVVSTLRRAITAKLMTSADAENAIGRLYQIGLTVLGPTNDLHRAALRWAERLKQGAAYDAQYLALAERLTAEFWTADRALANNAHQQGAEWVKLLGVDAT
ncbi:MAG TPA: type II toxin-antitoxin system VapC family toxin [Candidatus Eremiobacteraceae bacterium]|nr:type II toxin-antitoxin system VapC family toxin [Candidatus Eremiobacteraceae bacterium]